VNVLGDIVARERRSDRVAIRTASRAGSYSYDKACTQSWKAGNLLRHYGVREGATVAIDTGERLEPTPLVAFFGAALLGARVRFDPDSLGDARALVVPGERVAAYDPGPGTKVLAYGEEPENPTVAGFEREVWSENPTEPPDTVQRDAVALIADEDYTHADLVAATERVVDDIGMDADTTVVPRAPLSEPGTVVAGVLAPLVAGETISVDPSVTGDVGVGRDVPEERSVDPAAVF
jgi:hypothetical protein